VETEGGNRVELVYRSNLLHGPNRTRTNTLECVSWAEVKRYNVQQTTIKELIDLRLVSLIHRYSALEKSPLHLHKSDTPQTQAANPNSRSFRHGGNRLRSSMRSRPNSSSTSQRMSSRLSSSKMMRSAQAAMPPIP
jgi:hypothetical protein